MRTAVCRLISAVGAVADLIAQLTDSDALLGRRTTPLVWTAVDLRAANDS